MPLRSMPHQGTWISCAAGGRSPPRGYRSLLYRGVVTTHTPVFGRLGLPEAELRGIADQIQQAVPMKRCGSAEEIAKAVLFLSCADSGFMTGGEIVADGGLAQM